MVTWRSLLAEAASRLGEVDARRIVERASGLEGAEWVLGLDDAASQRGVAFFDAMVERRAAGEPLQYVVGRWGFRSLDLMVDRRVLIPRPETEIVAGAAIDEARRLARPVTVVDLGTGSGAIALSIASEIPESTVWATDRSADALAVARANLAGLGRAGARVRLAAGEWFAALPPDLRGAVDVVVSNPPYVATDETLPAEVAEWEPAGALVAGPRGVEDLERIVDESVGWLAPDGSLVVELAPWQAGPIADRARVAGFAGVQIRSDLTGRDRMVVARRSAA